MSSLIAALTSIAVTWRIDSTNTLASMDAAIAVFRHTRAILEPTTTTLDAGTARAYAVAMNHIATQRAHAPPLPPDPSPDPDETTIQRTTLRVFMYIVECQLRLALAHAKQWDALNDGTPIGAANARVTRCTFDAPHDASDVICDAKTQMRLTGTLHDDMHNRMAYTVCFKEGAPATAPATHGWTHLEACEVFTAHVWATVCVEAACDAFPLDMACDDASSEHGGSHVHTWHEAVCNAQHQDEFIVDITDALIRENMYECEAFAPETFRTHRESKPRRGYHWYTRCRVAREGDPCDELYTACNVRSPMLPPTLKNLTMVSYIDYYMKHAGVETWMALCYVDAAHYPKAALDALAFRLDPPVGHPRMPPLLVRRTDTLHCVVTFHHETHSARISPCVPIDEAVALWARAVVALCDGFLAPRVSCMPVLERLLALKPDESLETLNLVDEVRHAPSFTIL